VQLHQVEGVDAEVAATSVVPGAQGFTGEGLGHVRVGAPSHLRGHRQASIAALAQQPPDQLLAAPVAVHVGGVEEAHPGVDGGVQRRERILLADRPPVRAELPAPHPDDPYLTTRATQLSRLHDPTL